MADLPNACVENAEIEAIPMSEPTTQSVRPPLAPLVVVPSLLLLATTFMVTDPIGDLYSLLGGGESSPRKGHW